MSVRRPPGQVEGRAQLGIVLVALVASGIGAYSFSTWIMEIAWIPLVGGLIVANWRRFPLTRLLSWLLVFHAIVLCYGGHYTYALTPVGDWVRDMLDLSRNPYDRFGHFVQGFVPAILVRELLLRLTPLRRGGWLFFLTTSVCLAFSAFFEFIEWWSALILGSGATAYLATQGDVWDTQWDMFLCLCGALVSQLLLIRWHNRQLGDEVDAACPRRTGRSPG
jgi:putative membrane protein